MNNYCLNTCEVETEPNTVVTIIDVMLDQEHAWRKLGKFLSKVVPLVTDNNIPSLFVHCKVAMK